MNFVVLKDLSGIAAILYTLTLHGTDCDRRYQICMRQRDGYRDKFGPHFTAQNQQLVG